MMSESNHTPGPWAVCEYNNGITGEYGLHGIFPENYDRSLKQQTPIVEKVWGSTLAESDANANLIAAAPDLRDALAQAIPYFEELAKHLEASEMPGHAGNVTIHLHRMRAAIAKATGQNA